MRWIPRTRSVVVDIGASESEASTDSGEGIWRDDELVSRYRRSNSLDVLPAIRTFQCDRSLDRIGTLEMHEFIKDRKCRVMDVGTGHVQSTDRLQVVVSR